MERPTPEPALAVMAMQRRSITASAKQIQCSRHHLSRVLNGHERPSERIKNGLAADLGLPAEVLFRDRSAS